MAQAGELTTLRTDHAKLQEDEKRLTLMLFEKTKAWEKEAATSTTVRPVNCIYCAGCFDLYRTICSPPICVSWTSAAHGTARAAAGSSGRGRE